jgi:hypothetical protein
LFDALNVGQRLRDYSASLPRLQHYYHLTPESDQCCKTSLSYRVSDKICIVVIHLPGFAQAAPRTAVENNLQIQSIIQNTSSQSSGLVQGIKKIIHAVLTPFRYIYACFDALLFQKERRRREAFLDDILHHFEKPEHAENWHTQFETFNNKFRQFSLSWPYKTPEITCKYKLAMGFIYFQRRWAFDAGEAFQEAIKCAPNDNLRLYAYCGLLAVNQHKIHAVEKSANRIDLGLLEKVTECTNHIKSLASPDLLRRFQDDVIKPLSDCFEEYCAPHDIDKISKINKTITNHLCQPGTINSALLQVYFPETQAKLHNFTAHLCLLNEQYPLAKGWDIETQHLQSRHHIEQAIHFAEQSEVAEKENLLELLRQNLDALNRLQDRRKSS